ncbi:glycosyltransferase [Yersinia intermedia]|nr:glycosyltransferase [Yersinia intermedia]MCB5297637.1 glycosyltransferase [Yersinia intermedia]
MNNKNRNPLVSVILPVYNSEKFLTEALLSIIEQLYSNIEIIIINDGSTDNSLEIIKYFQKRDHRIKIISRENRGLVSSLNEGISNAEGDFIARMDADDISAPDRIYKQLNYILANPSIDILGSNIEYINDSSEKIGESKYPLSNLQIRKTLPFWCCLAHPTILAKKSVFVAHEQYKSKYRSEDYELWLRLRRNKKIQFGNMRESLLKYRLHGSQMTDVKNLKLIVKSNLSLKMRELVLTRDIVFLLGMLRDIISLVYSKVKTFL